MNRQLTTTDSTMSPSDASLLDGAELLHDSESIDEGVLPVEFLFSDFRTLPAVAEDSESVDEETISVGVRAAVSDVVGKALAQGVSMATVLDVLEDIRTQLTERISEQNSTNEAKGVIGIDERSAQEIVLSDIPRVQSAVSKLMRHRGLVKYQTAKGRAAMNVLDWMRVNLIETGILSARELSVIPIWVFRSFDNRLYTALFNNGRIR